MTKNKGRTVLTGILLAAAVICYSAGPGREAKTEALVLESGSSGEAYAETLIQENMEETESGEMPENRATESAAEAESRTDRLYVHVCGEVKIPGVYELPEGSRSCDAIAAAGGFTEEAEEDFLNLAQPVWDGQKLYVPDREEAKTFADSSRAEVPENSGGSMPGGSGSPENGRININTASREQLMTLPGIGEARAEAILAYRREAGPFLAIEDIMKVSGIKEAAFQKIKDDITV